MILILSLEIFMCTISVNLTLFGWKNILDILRYLNNTELIKAAINVLQPRKNRRLINTTAGFQAIIYKLNEPIY